jgi:hypothetical protein
MPQAASPSSPAGPARPTRWRRTKRRPRSCVAAFGGLPGEVEPGAGRVEFLNPDGLPRDPAFSNVAVVSGSVRTIYIGGQDAVDAGGDRRHRRHRGTDRAGPEQFAHGPGGCRRRAGARREMERHGRRRPGLLLPATRRSSERGATDAILRSSRPPSSSASRIPDFLVEMDAIAVVLA